MTHVFHVFGAMRQGLLNLPQELMVQIDDLLLVDHSDNNANGDEGRSSFLKIEVSMQAYLRLTQTPLAKSKRRIKSFWGNKQYSI